MSPRIGVALAVIGAILTVVAVVDLTIVRVECQIDGDLQLCARIVGSWLTWLGLVGPFLLFAGGLMAVDRPAPVSSAGPPSGEARHELPLRLRTGRR